MKINMKLAILCAALLLSACSNNNSNSIKGKDEIEPREQAEAKEKNSEEGKEDTEAKEDTKGDNSNGVIPEAGGVKADSYDFGTYEVNERYGDESFTNRDSVDMDDWGITQDKDTVTIYFFDYSTGDILKSTGKNNRWISKDERVLSKEFDSIPPELADYHFVDYSNTLNGYFRLKGSFMYRLFKQDVKKEVGYTYNYALVRTNLETKESTIIDKVSSDLLVHYSYFNVSGGGNGVGRFPAGNLLDTVLFVDDSEPIIDNSDHSISGGYFDKDTGEFFYRTNNYLIQRINIFTEENLYDGAERKSLASKQLRFQTLGGFESNGYIYLVDAPNAKDYERSPSEVYMYDSNLDLHASVPIPFDLNGVIQLVDSEQITLWKVLEYQDKPGLQLVTINK